MGDFEREMATLTGDEVAEHVSEVMFDTHDADPDCLLCQRGVELGVWARYGYPNGPWADEGQRNPRRHK